MDIKEMRDRLEAHVKAAREITGKAETERRNLTANERVEVEELISRATELKALINDGNDAQVKHQLDVLAGGPTGSGRGGLFEAFNAAGWEPGRKASIPAEVAFKGASFDGSLDDLNPARVEGAPLPADRRYLFEVFPATGESAGTTSVQVVEQSSRTLASPALMVRAIDSSGDKPETSSVRTLTDLPMKQVASVESGIPNIILLQDGFRAMVDVDLRLAYELALDDVVVDAIAAANPTLVSQGTDLTEQIVYAAADLAAIGYTGRPVAALDPYDIAALELKRGADEQFARTDPLRNVSIVPAFNVGTGAGYVLIPRAAGRVFLSAPTLASFEENDGKTNTSLVRYEGTAAFAVDRVDAIVELSASS